MGPGSNLSIKVQFVAQGNHVNNGRAEVPHPLSTSAQVGQVHGTMLDAEAHTAPHSPYPLLLPALILIVYLLARDPTNPMQHVACSTIPAICHCGGVLPALSPLNPAQSGGSRLCDQVTGTHRLMAARH